MKIQNQFQVLRREKKLKTQENQPLPEINGETSRSPVEMENIVTLDDNADDNANEIFKITQENSNEMQLEIFKASQFEIEGNLKITVQKGKVQVSGKIFKQGERITVYSSINHVILNAKSACLLHVENFKFEFNVKLLKELDQDFKITFARDLLGTKLSCTAMTSVIIGPVNSGKSTTARYLTNLYLNNHDTVAYLDCDLGQPEFTPPGMVSLTMVKDPLLGPPCTHFKLPKHSIFIGDTTPKRDPDAYITGLYKLVDVYRKECNGIPLVVNTSGWVRGSFNF
jgi:polynucleotide 5'-kinase involved in rRNA processing